MTHRKKSGLFIEGCPHDEGFAQACARSLLPSASALLTRATRLLRARNTRRYPYSKFATEPEHA